MLDSGSMTFDGVKNPLSSVEAIAHARLAATGKACAAFRSKVAEDAAPNRAQARGLGVTPFWGKLLPRSSGYRCQERRTVPARAAPDLLLCQFRFY